MFLFGGWGVWVWVYVLAFFIFSCLVLRGGSLGLLADMLVRQNQTSDLWIGWAVYPDQGVQPFPPPSRLERFSFIPWWAFLHCLWIRSVGQTVTPASPHLCHLSRPWAVESLLPVPWMLNILPVISKAKLPHNGAWNPGAKGGREPFAFLFFTWCGRP